LITLGNDNSRGNDNLEKDDNSRGNDNLEKMITLEETIILEDDNFRANE